MAAVNDRSGLALVTDILMPGLIRFRDRHFLYRNGKHTVRDIALSGALSKLVPDAEELTQLTEAVLGLYLLAENERQLRFEIPENSVLRAFLPDAHVTGMTFLNLFTNGVLKLKKPEDPKGYWTLEADPVFREAVPDAENRLWTLFKVIQSAGSVHSFAEIVFKDQKLVRTEKLSEEMSLTYEWDSAFEKVYVQGESPETEETERERAVRLNREASLKKTLELIRAINGEAAPENEEEESKHV